MEDPKALGIGGERLRSDENRGTDPQFVEIVHMGLDNCVFGAVAPVLGVGGIHRVPERRSGVVADQDVVGHVEMPVLVDPLGLHDGAELEQAGVDLQ